MPLNHPSHVPRNIPMKSQAINLRRSCTAHFDLDLSARKSKLRWDFDSGRLNIGRDAAAVIRTIPEPEWPKPRRTLCHEPTGFSLVFATRLNHYRQMATATG